MRPLELSITTIGTDGKQDQDSVICDSYGLNLTLDGQLYRITFVNGLNEEGRSVKEMVIHASMFVSIGVVELPEETVTITKPEYVALKAASGQLDDMVALAASGPMVLVAVEEFEAMKDALSMLTDLNSARHAEAVLPVDLDDLPSSGASLS